MKKIILILIAFAACCIAASAQTVESIRKDYNDVQAEIKLINDPDYPPKNRYSVTVEQMLGGSGQHNENVTMYFYEDEDEEHPGNSIRSIHFVTVNYNFAAMKYHEEYLFAESGVLEFVYGKDYMDGTEYEYRFYCNSNGVIKVIVNTKEMDEDKFKQAYAGAMTEKYKYNYNLFKDRAERYKKLFAAIEDSTYK